MTIENHPLCPWCRNNQYSEDCEDCKEKPKIKVAQIGYRAFKIIDKKDHTDYEYGDALKWFPELEMMIKHFNIRKIEITLTDGQRFRIERILV